MASSREVAARLRADSRKLSPDLRRARAKFKKFGKGVKRDLKRSFSKATSVLKSAAGLGGIIGFAALGKDVLDFERKLKRLEIAAGRSNINLKTFRQRIDEVSGATGQSRQELLGAASKFTELTGDVKLAQDNLELFAKIATGTGASLDDIVQAAVAVQGQFTNIRPDQLEKVFDIMITQGKAGSVEIKQVASEIGQLGGLFLALGKNSTEGLADLSAAFQVVQLEFGNIPEKARTGLNSFFTQILKQRKRLKKATGVDVLGRGGKQKDIIGILDELKAKGVGLSELLEGLGEAKAARAGNALLQNLDTLKRIKRESLDAQAVQKDFADFNESSAGRMAKAWERVKNKLAAILTPERLDKFADAMLKLADALSFVVDNIELFATAWVALKLGAIASQLAGAASGAGGLASALGRASGGVGVLAAAFAGFSIGTALDRAFGLSDKISDKLIKINKAKEASLSIRDQSKRFGAGGSGFVDAAERARRRVAGGKGETAQDKTNARRLLFFAEQQGITEGGRLGITSAVAASGIAGGDRVSGVSGKGEALVDQIRLAIESVRRQELDRFGNDLEHAAPGSEQISIKVEGEFRFDQNSLVTMDNPRIKKNRRGVTK